ncbi:MAG: outer membrane lipoprotein carrier protein LolA [Candidatus Eisenbacteria bacterium]
MRKKKTDPGLRRTLVRAAACALATWIVVALLPLPCAAEDGQRPEPTERKVAFAKELIASVIERYESERSYRISFSQESYWALADTTISSTGVLLLERPSMLSVRYGDGSTIASNGDTLRVYMSQTNQYFVTHVGPDDTVIDPPRVLRAFIPDPNGPFLGPTAVEVDAPAGGGEPVERIVKATLSLIPADGTGEPARLEVTVDPSRSIVTGMVAHTRSGDFTRYRISETQFGVDTTPADFVIDIPPEAERIGG